MPPLTTEAFRNLPTEPPEGESDLLYWLRKAVGVLGPATPAGVAASLMEQEVPTRAPSTASKIGSEGLDWMMLVGTLLPLLMGKGRGAEVFGKEMMDTSRRAYPKKWERIQSEQWRPFDEPEQPAQEALRRGRTSAQQRGWESLPPNRMPPEGSMSQNELEFRGKGRPADVTYPWGEEYRIGTPVELPGGAAAYYRIVPGVHGDFKIWLHYETPDAVTGHFGRQFEAGSYSTIGEATAKARQLANRLDLAAKDMQTQGWFGSEGGRGYRQVGSRRIRLPWESGIGQARDFDVPGRTTAVPGMWRDIPQMPGE